MKIKLYLSRNGGAPGGGGGGGGGGDGGAMLNEFLFCASV
jgi:hypothetical protein